MANLRGIGGGSQNCHFARWSFRKVAGRKLSRRKLSTQKTEAGLKVSILNGMAPQSLNDYMVARRIPTPKLAGKMARKLGYPSIAFVELALSDLIKKSGYRYKIVLEAA